MPTCGSLFSGIGGLDLGLHRAGWKHVFFCESDGWRRDVLRARFPRVPILSDVREIGARHQLERTRGGWATRARRPGEPARFSRREQPLLSPDLLCGGFPCQDLSVAGRRAGLAGARSGLFYEFVRIANTLRPRLLLIENVPGLLSSNGGRDFGVVLGTLADIGYGVGWRVLDSRFFGVPQRRRRVFIVGVLADGDPAGAAERAGQILAVGEGCQRHSAKGGEAGSDAPVASLSGLGTGGRDDNDGQGGRLVSAWAFGSHAGSNGEATNSSHRSGGPVGFGLHENVTPAIRSGRTQAIAAPLSHGSNPNSCHAHGDGETLIAHSLTSQGHDASEDGTGRGTPIVAAPLSHGSNPNSNMAGRRREDDENLVAFYPTGGSKDGFWQHNVSPPMKVGTGVGAPAGIGIAQTTGVRRLTPIECSRLQGMPDTWLVLESGYADAAEAHAAEVLHGLWQEAGSEAFEERTPRGVAALLTPEILLAGVHGGWISWEMAARRAEARRALSGSDAWPEDFVRGLWREARNRSTPYRRESFEQLARELGRSLSELPLEETQARAVLLNSRLWSEASKEWPLRSARAESQARRTARRSDSDPALLEPADSRRYAALGDAVTVNVAEWLGRRLTAGLA